MAILIVDDAADARDSLELLLNTAGYADVRTAPSGAAALEVLGAAAPAVAVDVVLMDILMPDMDGIETCRRIKALPAGRDLPVLMMTGQDDEHRLARAFAAGASDYLVKPVRLTELTARLGAALALKRERDLRQAREQDLMRLAEHLHDLATRDALTGLANRRHLDNHLAREWRRCQRSGDWLGVLAADVDHFKAYNDHHGHLRGDGCLQAVARVLGAAARRPADLAARYGGEEFLLILPCTDAAGLAAVAEEVLAQVRQLALPHGAPGRPPHVTLSLGGAVVIPGPGGRPEDLLAQADLALYAAKRAGRDRACFHGPVAQGT